MTFAQILSRVSGAMQGYSTLSTRCQPQEIVDALNQAQNDVACDLLCYAYRTAQIDTSEGVQMVLRLMQFGYWDWIDDPYVLTQPVDSLVNQDFLSVLENAPAMVKEGTVEPVLPYYAHGALIEQTVLILSHKFGDQKEAPKILKNLEAMYAQAIQRAKRTAVLRLENRPIRVEDASQPGRFIEQDWQSN